LTALRYEVGEQLICRQRNIIISGGGGLLQQGLQPLPAWLSILEQKLREKDDENGRL
jgi:hypothetical protein